MTYARLQVFFASMLILSGCSDRQERLRAVDEVEKHCDLQGGTLNRTQIEERFAVNDEMSEDSKNRAAKTVNLGHVMPHAAAYAKFDCINSFRSSEGYLFLLRLVSPTVLPKVGP